MTPEELKTPVTEIEISQLLLTNVDGEAAALTDAGRKVIRRMAFQLEQAKSNISPASYEHKRLQVVRRILEAGLVVAEGNPPNVNYAGIFNLALKELQIAGVEFPVQKTTEEEM